MWFRMRHALYALMFILIAVGAWKYPAARQAAFDRAEAERVRLKVEQEEANRYKTQPTSRAPNTQTSLNWADKLTSGILRFGGPVDPSAHDIERKRLARELEKQKKLLEKERVERKQTDDIQKTKMDERDKRIDVLEKQIHSLMEVRTDWASLGANWISALSALLSLWLAWLAYRGPGRARQPPPLPRA